MSSRSVEFFEDPHRTSGEDEAAPSPRARRRWPLPVALASQPPASEPIPQLETEGQPPARRVPAPDLALEAAGGIGEPGVLGTDAERVMAAIRRAMSDDGVLVLSELAGAADELKQALLVNPHDI